jgi:hypothetical protein
VTTPHQFVVAFAFASVGILTSCASKPEKPDAAAAAAAGGSGARSAFTYTAGQAGGTWQDTITGVVTVAAIDPAARTVTLVDADGARSTFEVSPEVRNFDQIHAGDKVSVTAVERITIFVDRDREGGAPRTAASAALVTRAPKGAKPGAIVAESFEAAATVTAIDRAARTATLRFADGDTIKTPVRADVDLARYQVGDAVAVQVTQHLTLLVAAP